MQRSERVILNLAAFLAVVCCGVLSLLAQSTVTTNPRITGEGAPGISFGTGGASAQTNGTIQTQYTSASNTSIGAEDVLYTYTLPGNTLLTNGQGVHLTAAGTFAANANTKSARVYFGATLVGYTSLVVAAPNNLPWRITADVLRTAPTAQVSSGMIGVAATSGWYALIAAPAADLTGNVTITVRGFSATAATDVTARLFIVETIR